MKRKLSSLWGGPVRANRLLSILGFVTALTLSTSAIAGAPLSATQVGSLELGMTWDALRGAMRLPTAPAFRQAIIDKHNNLRQTNRGIAHATLVSAGAIIYLRPTPRMCNRLVRKSISGVTDCLLTFGKSNATAHYRLVDISVTAGKARGAFKTAVERFTKVFGQPANSRRMQQPVSAPITAHSVVWGVQVMNNRIRIYLNQHSRGHRLNLSLRDAYAGAISHGRQISRMRRAHNVVGGYAKPRY